MNLCLGRVRGEWISIGGRSRRGRAWIWGQSYVRYWSVMGVVVDERVGCMDEALLVTSLIV